MINTKITSAFIIFFLNTTVHAHLGAHDVGFFEGVTHFLADHYLLIPLVIIGFLVGFRKIM